MFCQSLSEPGVGRTGDDFIGVDFGDDKVVGPWDWWASGTTVCPLPVGESTAATA